MDQDDQQTKKLNILEELEENPQIKQKDLASRLDIATGTVNWYIKRLASKGFLKVKRISQWQWKYILTPKGMKEKAELTANYIKDSMDLYRKTRSKCRKLLSKVKDRGYQRVYLKGETDLVDVCKLTCLEQEVKVLDSDQKEGKLPELKVVGTDLKLVWPKGATEEAS